ncbi:HD domain-containing phosphohydrolase [Treponema primitia]|uniref:HD domain-containing phosphohydrolase n=1 Tax=Treponema primitia TaxID=88058 RepID=UPI0002554F34|nr:HD domain-containing phosphohydrolase [Treponema primitia]
MKDLYYWGRENPKQNGQLTKKIVLVDDNITTLTLGSFTLGEKYNIFTVPSGEKLFILLKRVSPDLILLDIDMPEMDGYAVIKKLKDDTVTANIPVIFLTGKNDTGSELEGLNLGAIDYISKPLSPPLLLKRIELHLLVEFQKKELMFYNSNLTKMVLDMQNSVLKTVADLVESRDEITGGHVERTRRYLEILLDSLIGQKMYLEEIQSWNRDFLLRSSQLHDLGKIHIKDDILLKPGKLTDEEFNMMKNHTVFGVKIIDEIERHTPESSFLKHAKIFAGTHHEKWNGTGYPYGLSGENIPLQGRLMAIADVYDALISTRPYKAPLTHEEAVNIIMNGRGTHFDPVLTDLFAGIADEFSEINQSWKKEGLSEIANYAAVV